MKKIKRNWPYAKRSTDEYKLKNKCAKKSNIFFSNSFFVLLLRQVMGTENKYT